MRRVKRGLETKRRGKGRGTYESGRPPIITIAERFTGRVKFIVAESLSIDVINEIVMRHTEGPVIVYTDEYRVYNGLSKLNIIIEHRRVNHSEGVFAEGDAHINTAEGIHSRLRIFLRVHRGPNRGNLQFYVSFFAFYHNNSPRWLEKTIFVCLNKRRKDEKDICEANIRYIHGNDQK